MNGRFWRCLALAVWVGAPFANAELQLTLGVMGDSLSDEYFEHPTRAYAKNWLQQLAADRAVDPGLSAMAAGQPQGTWGPPRETGYAYNWAAAWATSRSLLDSGQATGLATQVIVDGVNCAVLAIGANDLNPESDAYAGIYAGTWTAARIRAQKDRTVANIRNAIVTIRRTGVPLILVNILDYGSTPAMATEPRYADARKRQRVTGVIRDLNTRLHQLAQTYQIPLVDWFSLAQRITGAPTNLAPVLLIGNRPIMMQQTDPGPGPSANPTAGYVADGFHPHTTIQGVLANTIIAALDNGCAANLSPFTEAEILQHAGLAYGGTDTLFACIGSYTNYVVMPVPLGPTGSFQLNVTSRNTGTNQLANWRLQIDISNKINPQNAIPKLSATAELIRPDGDRIMFPEIRVRNFRHAAATLIFLRGTNTALNSPRRPALATLVIRNLKFTIVNGNWYPQGGTFGYRQGGVRLFGTVE